MGAATVILSGTLILCSSTFVKSAIFNYHCYHRYGEEERAKKKTLAYDCHPYDESDTGPYVTFVFRYRPLGFLQANGIAPSSTSQSGFLELKDIKSECEAKEVCPLEEKPNAPKAKRKSNSGPADSKLGTFKRVKVEGSLLPENFKREEVV